MGVNLSSVCRDLEPRPSPAPSHHRYPSQECRRVWSWVKLTVGAHHLQGKGERQACPRGAAYFRIPWPSDHQCENFTSTDEVCGPCLPPLPWVHSEPAGPGEQCLYLPGTQGQCGSYVLEPCHQGHWASSCSQACSRNWDGEIDISAYQSPPHAWKRGQKGLGLELTAGEEQCPTFSTL